MKSRVIRIRPVSWRIFVQGSESADAVRHLLDDMNFTTTEPQREPDLADPPTFSFLATPAAPISLTQQELEAILEQDSQVELLFEGR